MLTFHGLSGKAAQDMEIRLEVRSPDFAYCLFGFSGGSVVKNPPANAGDVNSLPGLGTSLEKEMATHSSTLPEKSYGWRSLVDYGPWGRKVRHN